jgi:hypothetical protein
MIRCRNVVVAIFLRMKQSFVKLETLAIAMQLMDRSGAEHRLYKTWRPPSLAKGDTEKEG